MCMWSICSVQNREKWLGELFCEHQAERKLSHKRIRCPRSVVTGMIAFRVRNAQTATGNSSIPRLFLFCLCRLTQCNDNACMCARTLIVCSSFFETKFVQLADGASLSLLSNENSEAEDTEHGHSSPDEEEELKPSEK
jgi:hypothetical protein